jgi:butyrate kinase
VRELIKASYSGSYSQKQLDRKVFGEGGLFALLGTRDLKEVERRIDAGDERAAAVSEAMIYQVAKEAGAMASVLQGHVDACFSPEAWHILPAWSANSGPISIGLRTLASLDGAPAPAC